MLIARSAKWIFGVVVGLGAAMLLAGCASSGVVVANSRTPGKGAAQRGAPSPLPQCYIQAVAKADRFRNDVYYRLMLADGLRLVPPPRLFERMTAAAAAGENYKALYLARVLTEVAPENAGAWENRARLAGALGFGGEQEAAQKRASNPSTRAMVPAEFLPGRHLPSRPVSLPDWAGAVNLMADDVADREGHGAVVAVKDDVSGVLSRVGRQDVPYTAAAPIRLDDLLPNAFELRDVHAMKEHNTKGGWLAAGIFLSALSGLNAGYGNAAAAQDSSRAAAGAMAESGAVACHYKDGTFTARVFPGGRVRDNALKPQPAGEYSAIDTPTPELWLSGGSMSPTVSMRAASSSGGRAKEYVWDFRKGTSDRIRVADLTYPRLSILCVGTDDCTVPLSTMELMVSADDLRVFFQGDANLAGVLGSSFDMGGWNRWYAVRSFAITVAPENWRHAGEYRLVGYQPDGACFGVESRPDAWLAPIPGATTTASSE